LPLLLHAATTFIFAAMAVSAAVLTPRWAYSAENPRAPNVVFILADDLGWGDLHCYGHPYARTPHLDRLAEEGTRFKQCYSTGVTCCPARTGFMTGKFPATFATYPANGGFGDRVTITELLKNAGYRTGHFGKWHIGPDETSGTYDIDSIGANDEGGKKKRSRSSDGGRDAHIFNDAIKFIEANKAGPFYVNIWGHISHFQVDPAEKFVDEFKKLKVDAADFKGPMRDKLAWSAKSGDVDDSMRRYLGDVYSLDLDVGRLLAKLDELGLRENTIVVFSSDQGPGDPSLPEDDDKNAAKAKKAKPNDAATDGNVATGRAMRSRTLLGYTGGLRGGKHRQYEGGVRVPFIIRWPGHVPAQRVDERSVISGIDWLPTLCNLTGVKIDANDFDGQDVSSSWLGNSFERNRPLLWKTSSTNSDAAIRDGRWKFHGSHRKRGEVELYDLETDPTESKNIADQHPQVVKELQGKLDRWTATLPKSYDKVSGDD